MVTTSSQKAPSPATASEALERLTRLAHSLWPDDPSLPGILAAFLGTEFYVSLVRFKEVGGKNKIVVLTARHATLFDALQALAVKVDAALESGRDESGRIFEQSVHKLHKRLTKQEREWAERKRAVVEVMAPALNSIRDLLSAGAAEQAGRAMGEAMGHAAGRAFVPADDGWAATPKDLRAIDVSRLQHGSLLHVLSTDSWWTLVRVPKANRVDNLIDDGHTAMLAHESAPEFSTHVAYWVSDAAPF